MACDSRAGTQLRELREERGVVLGYHDPHIPQLPKMRRYRVPDLASVPLTREYFAAQDCVLIVTDRVGDMAQAIAG